ncbi:hypothetical protein V7O61_05170 [Methanolobus sp. WCC1]|uniref:hypothetical protein n=1 Tax=unclassified Methanolobus TaxID=2629569 RepID=UPI00324F3D3B
MGDEKILEPSDKEKHNLKNKLSTFIFCLFLILPLYVVISYQNNEYNKYYILLYSLISFAMIFIFTCLSLALFEAKFRWKTIKQKIVSFIVLVLIYYLSVSFLAIGTYSILNSFFPKTTWEIYPEYGTYMIPSFCLSILLLYRMLYLLELHGKEFSLFDSLELPFEIKIPRQIKEIKDILKGFIVGILLVSFSVVAFSKSQISIVTSNIGEFHLFSLVSSIIVAFIEFSVLFMIVHFPSAPLKNQNEIYPIRENQRSKYIRILDENKKVRYAFYFVSILLVVALLFFSPNEVVEQVQNVTVLEINFQVINSNVSHTSISNMGSIVPLVFVNEKQKPLTERMTGLMENNLGDISYSGKALEITTTNTIMPLTLKVRNNLADKTIDMSNSLNTFPSDYDTAIIYSFYNTGYNKCYSVSTFQDSGTMVSGNKIFFNFDEEDNIAVFLDAEGTTLAVYDYDVTIVTLNQTIGTEVKDNLEYDRNTASIRLLLSDPTELKIFNTSKTSSL